ncbi:unnamed protein product [Sphenostylis stenocarpa]|uniref:Uncharacterized protein n=1 Tax=Sphenostylis stenocarpa TaxID=92480 RepID=A0AA86TLN5_9FABA|nr:unnamed protein product [Sphenostylis stenocarpa]
MNEVTGCTCSGHGCTCSGHGRMTNFTCSQLIEVGSSPAAINFGVTLVGTFVFGILSEEHPRFEAVS